MHTNGGRVNAEDPYKTLGLEFGSTTIEIKAAYRSLAKKHHPDVFIGGDKARSGNDAFFRKITSAYEALMAKASVDLNGQDARLYSFQLWRKADILAQERTDVAGVKRVRPSRPAGGFSSSSNAVIDFSGTVPVCKRRGGDLIGGDSGDSSRNSSSVGRGQSKWHSKEALTYKPWRPLGGGTGVADDETLNKDNKCTTGTKEDGGNPGNC